MSAKEPDPKEVVEMRESLAEMGRTVRTLKQARESQNGIPRSRIRQAEEAKTAAKRDDETTRKIIAV